MITPSTPESDGICRKAVTRERHGGGRTCRNAQMTAAPRAPIRFAVIQLNSGDSITGTKGGFHPGTMVMRFPPPCPTSILSAHSAQFLMDHALFPLQQSCSSCVNVGAYMSSSFSRVLCGTFQRCCANNRRTYSTTFSVK